MSDTVWTPGPWVVDSEEQHDVIGSGFWIGPDENHGVHVLYPSPADARLIALAPELAAAVLRFVENEGAGYDAELDALAEKLRAIDKAPA